MRFVGVCGFFPLDPSLETTANRNRKEKLAKAAVLDQTAISNNESTLDSQDAIASSVGGPETEAVIS